MVTYREIIMAKELLDLPEQASLKEIKAHYRRLLRQWHPDRCREDIEKCEEMTGRITSAYACIRGYCDQYKYSFASEEIKKYMSVEDWWFERFGSDPHWGR
jgi:DnaJ-class molecular chaperone